MIPLRLLIFVTTIFIAIVSANRVSRQVESEPIYEDEQEAYIRSICTGRSAGEYFRLSVEGCRDVVQCTEAGLQSLRCPHGLAFDLNLQTCDWRENVKNCNIKSKIKKILPKFNTVDPLCQDGNLACGDETCIARDLFCDGKPDCPDGSDENACDIHNDPNRAESCNLETCFLPECFCIPNDSSYTPNKRNPLDIPQMVTITFDDAVNNNNIDLYETIFDGQRLNPNGCTIKATFFVSHKYTNYTAVEELSRQGHEIAVHSISHNVSESYWSHASVKEWSREIAGQRAIITNFANVTDVIGMRAPYLRTGGNNQFHMMETDNFIYDSTITAPITRNKPPFWPYMLYYRMPHKCHGNQQNCPTRSYAVWEMVMNELDRREEPTIEELLPGCAMVDSCFSTAPTREQFYNFLMNNFNRSYNNNRAPYGLYFHSAFLKNDPDILDAFLQWMQDIQDVYNDVYFVTMTQVIQWLNTNDAPGVKNINTFHAWQESCNPLPAPRCFGGNNCQLATEELPGETIRLATCERCPSHYPWLLDPEGDGVF